VALLVIAATQQTLEYQIYGRASIRLSGILPMLLVYALPGLPGVPLIRIRDLSEAAWAGGNLVHLYTSQAHPSPEQACLSFGIKRGARPMLVTNAMHHSAAHMAISSKSKGSRSTS
jgi:hypothetical protein